MLVKYIYNYLSLQLRNDNKNARTVSMFCCLPYKAGMVSTFIDLEFQIFIPHKALVMLLCLVVKLAVCHCTYDGIHGNHHIYHCNACAIEYRQS